MRMPFNCNILAKVKNSCKHQLHGSKVLLHSTTLKGKDINKLEHISSARTCVHRARNTTLPQLHPPPGTRQIQQRPLNWFQVEGGARPPKQDSCPAASPSHPKCKTKQQLLKHEGSVSSEMQEPQGSQKKERLGQGWDTTKAPPQAPVLWKPLGDTPAV